MLNTVNSEIFARVYFRESFLKIKPLPNGEITPSFTNLGKSCPSWEFLKSQICLLMLFAKIKFSRKFLDEQY